MPSTLRMGAAKTDITPEAACELSGFAARTQPSLGVHDPVWARALVFEAEGKRAAIVACDLLGFHPPVDARIRERLCREVGLEGVLLTCTHTHGAPSSMHLIGCGSPEEAWMEALETQIVGATRRAAEALTPVSARWAQTEIRIGMNRRAEFENHIVHLSRRGDRPVGSPEGVYDETLTALQIVKASDRSGQTGAATLFNHACHPVSLGHENRYVTCDWPGFAVRLLENAVDPVGFGSPLFIQGACGDINPDVEGRSWVESERIGMTAGEHVRASLRESGKEIEAMPLRYAERPITLPYRNDAGSIDVTLSALRLGEAAFVTLPGEAFCQQGIDIRRESPFPCTMIAAYSNGNMGYIPTREAYLFGGYEVDDAHRYYGYPECVTPEAGELCVKTALELLNECRS